MSSLHRQVVQHSCSSSNQHTAAQQSLLMPLASPAASSMHWWTADCMHCVPTNLSCTSISCKICCRCALLMMPLLCPHLISSSCFPGFQVLVWPFRAGSRDPGPRTCPRGIVTSGNSARVALTHYKPSHCRCPEQPQRRPAPHCDSQTTCCHATRAASQ